MIIRKPQAPSAPRRVPARVQEVMKEKREIREFPLACGHTTNLTITMLYEFAAPKGMPHFCEKCETFQARTRKTRNTPLPERPPF
jgi:hypothetical protein